MDSFAHSQNRVRIQWGLLLECKEFSADQLRAIEQHANDWATDPIGQSSLKIARNSITGSPIDPTLRTLGVTFGRVASQLKIAKNEEYKAKLRHQLKSVYEAIELRINVLLDYHAYTDI